MKEKLFDLIQEKSPGAKPLYLVIRGSHAYGTNIETSDVDFGGIYIQSHNDILGNVYKEQINDDNNDIVLYEIKRFLELIYVGNPNILELLNTPEDCVIYKDPIFDIVLENKDKFLTKKCKNSFAGYAVAQIKKARGQDKKQNWEKDKVSRKNPLDFCYIHIGEHSTPLKKYLEDNNLDQKFCGLSNVPHGKDTYALFYDRMSDYRFSEMRPKWERFLNNLFNNVKPLGFKGITFENSNELRLSSIPRDLPPSYFIGHISYNKDGYSQHCKDYKSYQEWLNNKNEQRWIDVKSHGQKIDGKNMMHCMRLIQMAREIGEGKGINVRRENAKELISIRKGEVDLETLISKVESEILEIDVVFDKSRLVDSIDREMTNDLLIKIRKNIYNL
jgi:hypothetical protein